MRRLSYAGLVPCRPEELAATFLDPEAAVRVWPALQRSVLRSGEDWYEVATAELGGTPGRPPVRLRRVEPTTVLVAAAGRGAWALHRFLPADGGCLWAVENHEARPEGEAWSHFARRRRLSAELTESLVDTAANYFAARRRP